LYFSIPSSAVLKAKQIGDLSNALGIHYRGTDKQIALHDTNPISAGELLSIIEDYLENHESVSTVFIATDEPGFVPLARSRLRADVINLGEVSYHKAAATREQIRERSERALIDCLALSMCRCVLLNSSALSAFAKILNPELDIYRLCASKMFTDIPYFPVAYIPKYSTASRKIQALIDRLMSGDWTAHPGAEGFKKKFAYIPRFGPDTSPLARRFNNPDADNWIGARRNAPCACGSGRRFKHCHGKLV
jgi:hypothetical protein